MGSSGELQLRMVRVPVPVSLPLSLSALVMVLVFLTVTSRTHGWLIRIGWTALRETARGGPSASRRSIRTLERDEVLSEEVEVRQKKMKTVRTARRARCGRERRKAGIGAGFPKVSRFPFYEIQSNQVGEWTEYVSANRFSRQTGGREELDVRRVDVLRSRSVSQSVSSRIGRRYCICLCLCILFRRVASHSHRPLSSHSATLIPFASQVSRTARRTQHEGMLHQGCAEKPSQTERRGDASKLSRTPAPSICGSLVTNYRSYEAYLTKYP